MEHQLTSFSDPLLKWYDTHHRDLPWRLDPPNPYFVWLSEIMLQQTTVKTVIPYFDHFTTKWPTLSALVHASLDDILVAWQGLGYYSRARNLHKCAQHVLTHHAGQFPSTEKDLLALPGIGPYTAAAIVSIAFGQPAAAVDGNVIRVLARYCRLRVPRPALDKQVKEELCRLLPTKRCGDFTQAIMELGAVICRPKSPLCTECPLVKGCQGREVPHLYPIPKEKKPLPTRYAVAYLVQREDGAILLRRRPESGLLGGMMEVPTTPWLDQNPGSNVVEAHAPMVSEDWKDIPGHVSHTFTHFHFQIYVKTTQVQSSSTPPKGTWVEKSQLKNYALPTVMKKIVASGL